MSLEPNLKTSVFNSASIAYNRLEKNAATKRFRKLY